MADYQYNLRDEFGSSRLKETTVRDAKEMIRLENPRIIINRDRTPTRMDESLD
jgi:hypothetical protein